jgi:hypothetical protein
MGRNTEPRDRVELKPQPRHYRLGLSHDDHQSSPTAGHTSACYEATAIGPPDHHCRRPPCMHKPEPNNELIASRVRDCFTRWG